MPLAELLWPKTLPALCREPGKQGGIQAYLDGGSFVPKLLSTGEVELAIADYRDIVRHLSADYERFALSSAELLETCISMTEQNSHSSAWRLITIYYSAFFSAHSILRSTGRSELFLRAKPVSYINAVAAAHGLGPSILATGSYSAIVQFPSVGTSVLIKLKPKTGGQGVHAEFWKGFVQAMDDLAQTALATGQSDAQSLFVEIDHLVSRITNNGVGTASWLPQVRNSLNYEHDHDSWFPQQKSSKSKMAAQRLKIAPENAFNSGHSFQNAPALAFGEACNLIALIGLGLAKEVSVGSTKGGTFGQRWRRLLAQAKFLE